MILRADLECFDPAWSGWVCRGGFLVSPEGWQISVNDVLATRLKDAQILAYQSENRELKYQLEMAKGQHLDEQPTTDEWDVQILYA